MLETVVVATDLSGSCERALELVARLLSPSGARVVLVHVIDDEGLVSFLGGLTTSTDEVQRAADDARRALKRMARTLLAHGLEAGVQVAVGPLAETLVATCRELEAGLLVMGTTPGTDLHNVLFGSVSAQVFAELKLPVLLVPAA